MTARKGGGVVMWKPGAQEGAAVAWCVGLFRNVYLKLDIRLYADVYTGRGSCSVV